VLSYNKVQTHHPSTMLTSSRGLRPRVGGAQVRDSSSYAFSLVNRKSIESLKNPALAGPRYTKKTRLLPNTQNIA